MLYLILLLPLALAALSLIRNDRAGWGFRPRSGMYLLSVYSVFKVHEGIRFVPQ